MFLGHFRASKLVELLVSRWSKYVQLQVSRWSKYVQNKMLQCVVYVCNACMHVLNKSINGSSDKMHFVPENPFTNMHMHVYECICIWIYFYIYICMYVHAHVQWKKVVCMYGSSPTLGAAEASRGGWASAEYPLVNWHGWQWKMDRELKMYNP